VGVSPDLLAAGGEHGVSISFMSEQGRFLARLAPAVSGNVRLRRQQHPPPRAGGRIETRRFCFIPT